MLLRYHHCLCAGVIGLMAAAIAIAQESAPEAEQAAEETTYFDLRRSNDRVARMVADRYFNLVKLQEWSDATGKSKVTAKYVEHDPDLEWVKLQAVRGRGAERVEKEITVPVAKLSKVCQSRVRQINALQKKLDELVAAADETDTADASGGGEFSDRGTPMLDERGDEPRAIGRERFAAPAEADVQQSSPSIESNPQSAEFEEDPLGFAEMELGPPPEAVAGEGHSPLGMPLLPTGQPAGNVERKQWSTSYAAFRANFTIGQDERGELKIDWGELDELRAIGARLAGRESVEAPPIAAERLGPVRWEAQWQGIRPTEQHTIVAFDVPPLPPPLGVEFRLDSDQGSSADDWTFSPGDRVAFTGRLAMAGPTSIVVYVSNPKAAASRPER